MAGDGGCYSCAQRLKLFILLHFVRVTAGLLDNLGEHSLECHAFQTDRGRLYRKCLRAKGFYLKTIALQLVGDLSKNDHLCGLEFHKHGH